MRQMLQQGCPADSAGGMSRQGGASGRGGVWSIRDSPVQLRASDLKGMHASKRLTLYSSRQVVTVPAPSMLYSERLGANRALHADYDARTALELACVKGHGGVVDLLLAAGANVNLQVNSQSGWHATGFH